MALLATAAKTSGLKLSPQRSRQFSRVTSSGLSFNAERKKSLTKDLLEQLQN